MTTGGFTDGPLVRRLRAGDEAAFGSLMASWSPLMLRLARRHVGTAQSAEDVVQDTWLSMLRALPRFEGRCSLRTWVFHILLNKARTCGARENRTLPWTAAFGPGPVPGRAASPEPDGHGPGGRWSRRTVPPNPPVTPEDALLAGEVRALIAETVARLSARQRAVLELRDVHGYTADEACRMLGLSGGNQRVLLHRARAAVRAGLVDYLKTAQTRRRPGVTRRPGTPPRTR